MRSDHESSDQPAWKAALSNVVSLTACFNRKGGENANLVIYWLAQVSLKKNGNKRICQLKLKMIFFATYYFCAVLPRPTLSHLLNFKICRTAFSNIYTKETEFERGASAMQLFMLWSPNFEEARFERGVT